MALIILSYVLTPCVGDRHGCTYNSFTPSTSLNQRLFYGHLLDTVTVASALDCASLCSTMSRCSGYKFHDSNMTCHTSRSVPGTLVTGFSTYVKSSGASVTGKPSQNLNRKSIHNRKSNVPRKSTQRLTHKGKKPNMKTDQKPHPNRHQERNRTTNKKTRQKLKQKASRKPNPKPNWKDSGKPIQKPTQKQNSKQIQKHSESGRKPSQRNFQLRNVQRFKATRVLLLPRIRRKAEVKQLFLHSSSLVTYPYLKTKYVTAAIYISSVRKLLIASAYPNKLFSVRLDRRGVESVNVKYVVTITADETKQLVFLATFRHGFGAIKRIRTEGKDLTEILRLEWKPVGIAADPNRQHIHINRAHVKIVKYTYTGKLLGLTAEGNFNRFLLIDPYSNVLYYLDRKNTWMIVKKDLSTSSTSEIPTVVSRGVIFISPCSNSFYLNYYDGSDIIIAILNDKGAVQRTMNTKNRISYQMVCV